MEEEEKKGGESITKSQESTMFIEYTTTEEKDERIVKN